MAESSSKTGILAKAQKSLSRTKTKVLQNLGKAEKTTDDVFTENVAKTERQQEVAQHLQKELKHYLHCIRDLSLASKNLHNALLETYEPDWTKEGTFKAQVQKFDLLWNDYLQNLQDQVLGPMQSYLQSFPVLKIKIAKRGRKLVDYDNARHHAEVLQAGKKKDETKLQKAQEELKEAKRIYDEMNNELHTEVPEFYNSRVTFYADLFSSMFGAEQNFHSSVGETNRELGNIASELAKDYEQFIYVPKQPLSKSMSTNSGEMAMNGETSTSTPTTPVVSTPVSSSSTSPNKEPVYFNEDVNEGKSGRVNGSGHESPPVPAVRRDIPVSSEKSSQRSSGEAGEVKLSNKKEEDKDDESNENNLYEEPKDTSSQNLGSSGTSGASATNHTIETSDDDDDIEDEDENEEGVYTSPPSNQPVKAPPPNTLYKVVATHKYTGEDVDELCFEPGEMIYVIQFENPDEQDDGWQMGIKESNGVKGVFPENFTQRI